MKKLLVLALGISSPLLASYDGCGYFDGFYAGITGGVATHMADASLETRATFGGFGTTVETLQDTSKAHIYDISPWGELFAGWGRQCGCYYWGGRLGINFSHFNPKLRSTAANLDPGDEAIALLDDSLKTEMWTAEYTFDFKPGIVFCERTMLFGILGAAINKERLIGKSQFTLLPGDGLNRSASDEIKVEKEKTSAGFRGGLGLEYMLTQCLSLQLSYVYTHYWHLKENVTQNFTDSVGDTLTHSVAFSTNSHKQVTSIGLAYYF